MGKDWTGNGKSIFTTLGASNHTEKEREIVSYCSCVQAVVVFPAILTILLLTDFSSNRQRHC